MDGAKWANEKKIKMENGWTFKFQSWTFHV